MKEFSNQLYNGLLNFSILFNSNREIEIEIENNYLKQI